MNRLVIHDMEAPEKATTAESVAVYFAKGSVVASCHYNVDSDSIVQCVREEDVAFHAPPNTHSIGIEHAGYARQSAEEWADAYSSAMLHRSAGLAADICRRHSLPVVWLSPSDLLAGRRGITSHANVSKAWRKSSHTDPGPGFPVEFYLSLVKGRGVQAAVAGTPGEYVRPVEPIYEWGEDDVRTRMMSIGPLDGQGNGWASWDTGFASPVPVGEVMLGPYPVPEADKGYADNDDWKGQWSAKIRVQPRGGAVIVTVLGGRPGGRLQCWVSVAPGS